jgi:hypothetical protein
MDKVNTDISKIPYHKRYKTDEDNYRWVMLEEAKISIESACKDIREQVIEKDKDIKRLNARLKVLQAAPSYFLLGSSPTVEYITLTKKVMKALKGDK